MKALKIAQIIGVLMIGVGIGIGYNGGSYAVTLLGIVVYAGAKLTSWANSKND